MAGRTAAVGAVAADSPSAPPRPLADSVLDWYADLYDKCAHAHHWTAAQVNELEVWEVYAALGHARDDDAWALAHGGQHTPGGIVVPSQRDLTAERARWLRGQGEKPKAEATTAGRLQTVTSRAPGG